MLILDEERRSRRAGEEHYLERMESAGKMLQEQIKVERRERVAQNEALVGLMEQICSRVQDAFRVSYVTDASPYYRSSVTTGVN